MNSINQKYKTVAQIALKDIAEYQRNFYKDKQLRFFSENVVTPSKLDDVCVENNIDHRLTKPFTPKTNGIAEKANDIIKSGTIKVNQYINAKQMNNDLTRFLVHYNL